MSSLLRFVAALPIVVATIVLSQGLTHTWLARPILEGSGWQAPQPLPWSFMLVEAAGAVIGALCAGILGAMIMKCRPLLAVGGIAVAFLAFNALESARYWSLFDTAIHVSTTVAAIVGAAVGSRLRFARFQPRRQQARGFR